MRLLQLSDPHVRVAGDPLAGRVETLPFLERAITAVNRLAPAPDVVLITGDIVDQMAPQEYRLARTALERLAPPLFVLPGNHDGRAGFLEFLAPYLGAVRGPDCLAYLIDRFPLRLVALDSVIPMKGRGLLGPEQLAWLDQVLREGATRPTLLALHHPPFEVGIRFMDRLGLEDRDALADVVLRHPQVAGVIAGHVHQTIIGRIGGVVAMTAPSIAHQIPLDLAPDGPETFVFEPPGFLLHEWDGTALRSHHGYLENYGERHRFG